MPQGGGEGVIVTQGGRFGGYGLYLLKGKPTFTWNLLDLKRVKWEGPDVLAPGKHTLAYDFKYDGLGFATLAFNNISGLGHPGTGTLSVDGKVVATQTMERTIPLLLPWDETFDIGSDTGTPVDDADYQVPFAFTGKIDKLTISVTPPMLTDQDKHRLMEAEHAAQDANLVRPEECDPILWGGVAQRSCFAFDAAHKGGMEMLSSWKRAAKAQLIGSGVGHCTNVGGRDGRTLDGAGGLQRGFGDHQGVRQRRLEFLLGRAARCRTRQELCAEQDGPAFQRLPR